jgi:ABC-type transport system involved in cytochrome c biogenesis permease component
MFVAMLFGYIMLTFVGGLLFAHQLEMKVFPADHNLGRMLLSAAAMPIVAPVLVLFAAIDTYEQRKKNAQTH